ncbi:1332_t:CDS:2, partial [Entrophospora sp. SA101]
SKDRQDNWANTEIVHVILLLSTFHSMSSYVLGCGIVPEYDSIGGNYEDVSFNNADNVDGGNSDYKAIGLLGDIEEINPDVGAGLGVKLTIDDDSSIHSIKDIDDGDINNSNIGDSNNNDTSSRLSSTPKLCKFENCDERAEVIRLINRWAKTCAKKCYPQQISDITTKNNSDYITITSPHLPKRSP